MNEERKKYMEGWLEKSLYEHRALIVHFGIRSQCI